MSRSETRMIVKMNSLAATDQSEQHDRERANLNAQVPVSPANSKNREKTNLDQSGHQQDCDTAFGTIH